MPYILCRIVWAEKYEDKREEFYAGNMKYPHPHEMLNFRDEGGFAYGFVQASDNKINLKRLSNVAGAADELSGVTVIWCAPEELSGKLRLVGWYDNALAFSALQKPKRGSLRGGWKYQFKTAFQDAHLLAPGDRYLAVPTRKKRTDKGYFGERNWFFPEHRANHDKFLEAFKALQAGLCESQKGTTPSKTEKSVVDQESFQEGQRAISEINLSIRNPKLVAAAKKHYGYCCSVCDFDFEKRYGKVGAGYIEVHHLLPFRSATQPRDSTIENVRVVCANCHRMMHRRSPPYSVSQLKSMLR